VLHLIKSAKRSKSIEWVTLVGLRELRYRLGDGAASDATRLGGEAIAAISEEAPELEVAELWLTQENVAEDLSDVFELLDNSSLARLELGVHVTKPKYGGVQEGKKEELMGEVAAAMMELDAERKARVVLLD